MRAFSLLPAFLLLGLVAVTLAAEPPKGGKEKEPKDKDEHHEDEHHDDEHHRPGEPDLSSVKGSKGHDEDGHHSEEFDHEAVTGSHKEAEQFKELSPEESKKRLGVLVGKMDLNKDGVVDVAELKVWIHNSFKNLDREDARQKLEDHDENHDKKVGWWEYVEKSYGYKEKEVEKFKQEKSKDMKHFIEMLADDEEKFKLADANKDGFLDLEEYVAFTHPTNTPRMAPYEIKRTLRDYDKNKDNVITKEEFFGADKMDAKTRQAEEEHFTEFDKDKNGKLEGEEIEKWIMPGQGESAQREAEHLLKETDTNKDGKLTKDEIVAKNEMWVGSQATDYGKHLEDLKKDEL